MSVGRVCNALGHQTTNTQVGKRRMSLGCYQGIRRCIIHALQIHVLTFILSCIDWHTSRCFNKKALLSPIGLAHILWTLKLVYFTDVHA